MSDDLETLDDAQLLGVHGGMPAAAHWIMMHEGTGSTTQGHMYSAGRGNGFTKHNHSSAFGAFQMIKANRIHYMGKNWKSTNFNDQYAAATHYMHDRYGSWDRAKSFWLKHRWW